MTTIRYDNCLLSQRFLVVMKRIIFFFFFFLFFTNFISEADDDAGLRFTVSGYIKDAESGEGLNGATVLVRELQKGSVSNLYGFYSLSLFPGVQASSEGASGFSVRGGNPDQNLILLDEATVYNASHLMVFSQSSIRMLLKM